MALDKITAEAIAPGAVTLTAMPDGVVTATKLHTTAITDKLGYTPVSPTQLATKADAANLSNVENKSSATIRSEITSGNVTSALGFTPYNSTNPNGYISDVTTALGYTPVSPTQLTNTITSVVGSAPAALDTLNEIAAALGNDANYASTITNTLSTKANASSFTNVENKSSATIRSEITSGNVTTALGYTPYNSSNPNGYLSSVAGSALTGTSLASGIVSSSLTSVGTLSSLRSTGLISFGSNTFTKSSYGIGDLALDNGSNDTPALLLYYANNKNWGIDSWNNGSKQILRFVSDLNEANGAERASLDNTGKFTAASFAGNGSQLTGVIQVVQAVKTDVFIGTAPNNTTFTAITGLSATITPKSTSSKILIMTSINYDSTRSNSGGGFAIFRNGSRLDGAVGAANGNNYRVFGDFGANANADQSGMNRAFQVVDSPSTTSATTYDIRFTQDGNSFTTYINKARYDDSSGAQTDDGRFASSIVLMEIA